MAPQTLTSLLGNRAFWFNVNCQECGLVEDEVQEGPGPKPEFPGKLLEGSGISGLPVWIEESGSHC